MDKEVTCTITFKCDGCGKRVSYKKLYGRGNTLYLNKGQFTYRHSGNKIVVINMTCSKLCSHRTKVRLYSTWLEKFKDYVEE